MTLFSNRLLRRFNKIKSRFPDVIRCKDLYKTAVKDVDNIVVNPNARIFSFDELLACYSHYIMRAVQVAIEYAKHIDPKYLNTDVIFEALHDGEQPEFLVYRNLANTIKMEYIKETELNATDHAKLNKALMGFVRQLSDELTTLAKH